MRVDSDRRWSAGKPYVIKPCVVQGSCPELRALKALSSSEHEVQWAATLYLPKLGGPGCPTGSATLPEGGVIVVFLCPLRAKCCTRCFSVAHAALSLPSS